MKNRVQWVEVGEYSYPMCFSLGAIKALTRRYGDLESMSETLQSANAETFEGVGYIIETLSKSGAAYMNMMGGDAPENAKRENGDYVGLTSDVLDVACGMEELTELMQAITETMSRGSETEIETDASTKN